jgi:hypothetical protein
VPNTVSSQVYHALNRLLQLSPYISYGSHTEPDTHPISNGIDVFYSGSNSHSVKLIIHLVFANGTTTDSVSLQPNHQTQMVQ